MQEQLIIIPSSRDYDDKLEISSNYQTWEIAKEVFTEAQDKKVDRDVFNMEILEEDGSLAMIGFDVESAKQIINYLQQAIKYLEG